MTAPVAIDPSVLRRAMGQFASGVTVISTLTEDGLPIGCTVSAFSSLSLNPPLVLVCIDAGRFMHQQLSTAPGFVVNVLSAKQADVAMTFARPADDRFHGINTHRGRRNIPLLDGAIAHIQCDRSDVLPGGDHAIIVGRVHDVGVNNGEPLLYAKGAFLHVNDDAWDRALAQAPHEWLLSAPW